MSSNCLFIKKSPSHLQQSKAISTLTNGVKKIIAITLLVIVIVPLTLAQRKMEYLTRGLVAVQCSKHVFLSWRTFATDDQNISFNLYRNDTLVNQVPISGISNFTDPKGNVESIYYLEIINGGKKTEISTPVTVWNNSYLTIPIQTPPGYTPNDASVADLDGDGQLEIIIKMDGRTNDNAHSGTTDPVFLHAYKMNGTFLWSINLGSNIRGGAHYTQLMVYDLDGDGRAEVACKTAPGTIDGTGEFISDGPATNANHNAKYANSNGHIIAGPEYLTVFDGRTAKELSTVDYIPQRATPYPYSTWGDTDGNRSERYLACVAYFDTIPSLVMCRGYYSRTSLTAWDFVDKKLVKRWAFDTQDDPAKYRTYTYQGAHSLSVGDVDNDGKDEIMYGAMAINHDGTAMYSTNFNHGDATHLGDLIPSRPGLEFYMPSESAGRSHDGIVNPAIHVRDAATGEVIWAKYTSGDIGRALTADICPDNPGNEFWASGHGVYNSSGNKIDGPVPSMNFAVWWDGDPLRELLDGIVISKWKEGNILTASGCMSNNGTKSTPVLSGDILGDWREEVIWRSSDNKSLRVYTTTDPTEYGIYTLLHDPQYRLALTWQNVAYNQPPHPSFFIGHDMETPPSQDISIIKPGGNPSLSIMAPINGQEHHLGRDINVIVHAVGLSETNPEIVIFGNNNQPIDTISSPPYKTSLSGLQSGDYTIIASAFNSNGEKVESQPVIFSIDLGLPNVKLISPVSGITMEPKDTIFLLADAFDTDGKIDSVAFFINGERYISITESPYEAQIINPANGSYQIYARAYDNNQKFTNSEMAKVEVGAILIVQENETGFCGFGTTGGLVEHNHQGFTGTGFANGNNVMGGQIIWTVDIPQNGNYSFSWRYASSGARPARLYINNKLIGTVNFSNTVDWTSWMEASLTTNNLEAGISKIVLESTVSTGLPNIDYLKIVSLSTSESVSSADCSLPPNVSSGRFENNQQGINKFSLYPVPAKGHLSICMFNINETIEAITIFRIDGSKIRTINNINNAEIKIDISDVTSGSYLIQVNSNSVSYTRKFIVIK